MWRQLITVAEAWRERRSENLGAEKRRETAAGIALKPTEGPFPRLAGASSRQGRRRRRDLS